MFGVSRVSLRRTSTGVASFTRRRALTAWRDSSCRRQTSDVEYGSHHVHSTHSHTQHHHHHRSFSSFGSSSPPLPTLLLSPDSVENEDSSSSPTCSRTLTLEQQSTYLNHSGSSLFELTFLGTASGRPTPVRNVSSLALRIGGGLSHDDNTNTTNTNTPQRLIRSRILLFDCGDGTQLRWMNARHLALERLSFIFLTHMHGDHIFGLPNMVAAVCNKKLSTTSSYEPLHIFGPQGIAQYVKTNIAATHTWMDRPIIFHELLKNNNPDYSDLSMQVYEDDDIIVHAGPLTHRSMSCWGYVVTEKSSITGSKFEPRKLLVLGDTCDSSSLKKFGMHADVCVHEATFLDSEVDKVYGTGHSTAGMAGTFGRSLHIQHLILTHFSHRYIGSELLTGCVDTESTQEHVRQAQATAGHQRVHVAQDFRVFHVAQRRRKEDQTTNKEEKEKETNVPTTMSSSKPDKITPPPTMPAPSVKVEPQTKKSNNSATTTTMTTKTTTTTSSNTPTRKHNTVTPAPLHIAMPKPAAGKR